MIEDNKINEKREMFFKAYFETFGINPKIIEGEKEIKKEIISMNIFGIKANI